MSSGIDNLLAGVAGRREAQEQKDREAYAGLVDRLAAGTPGREDTPAKVGDVLERLGLHENRLRQDVTKAEAFNAKKAKAAELLVVEVQRSVASVELDRAVAQEREWREKGQAVLWEAQRRYREASDAIEKSARAERQVFDEAKPELVARYRELSTEQARLRSELHQIADKLAGGRTNIHGALIPSPEGLDTSDERIAVLEQELAAIDERVAESQAAALASASVPLFPAPETPEAEVMS